MSSSRAASPLAGGGAPPRPLHDDFLIPTSSTSSVPAICMSRHEERTASDTVSVLPPAGGVHGRVLRVGEGEGAIATATGRHAKRRGNRRRHAADGCWQQQRPG